MPSVLLGRDGSDSSPTHWCPWWPAGILVSELSQAACILIALSSKESTGEEVREEVGLSD